MGRRNSVAARAKTLQLHTDSVQLFKNRDNLTSNVFIEVFEGFIDESFTKTAKFVHCNLGLRLGVSQKPSVANSCGASFPFLPKIENCACRQRKSAI